jgi:hypothetical protein
MDNYPFKSLIETLVIHWHLSTKIVQLVQLSLCLLEFDLRFIHGINGIIHKFEEGVQLVERNTMGVPVRLPRVKGRLETLVTFDNLVDMGLVHGGHTDGDRHLITYGFTSLTT